MTDTATHGTSSRDEDEPSARPWVSVALGVAVVLALAAAMVLLIIGFSGGDGETRAAVELASGQIGRPGQTLIITTAPQDKGNGNALTEERRTPEPHFS